MLPLSGLFRVLSSVRHRLYRYGIKPSISIEVPVIVVGNISVGGTGKSPVVQALALELELLGWKPGIVVRGYGGRPQITPILLTETTLPSLVGDEAVMHKQGPGVPVCVCVDRAQAAQELVRRAGCNLVLADDGLQHYRLARDIEIAVVDGVNGFGNGWLLPAGPLREPLSRLRRVDCVLIKKPPRLEQDASTDSLNTVRSTVKRYQKNVHSFSLQPTEFVRLTDGSSYSLDAFSGTTAHALAGIGNPGNFFGTLKALGIDVLEHPKNDHYNYALDDIEFNDELPVIVTSKDAVKLNELHGVKDNVYLLQVRAEFDGGLRQVLKALPLPMEPHD
ncbi:MAG: tetraacyldisaccharide 4'-kinase [Gammaproteobacteria bacterium]|nr:tetraacyldisaccharide 4'-kinase [Gammaproteobacteria bacterium]